MSQIDVNQENYKAIKKLYNQAVKDNQEVFKFHGAPLLVSYAKYVLEYMEGILKIKPKK